MIRLHILLFATALAGGCGLALAQEATGDLDLVAIRARAKNATADAEALAASARARADQLRDEARGVDQAARTARSRYAAAAGSTKSAGTSGPFDFDALVAGISDAEKASLGSAPRFIAFASLSMPKDALRAMLRDVPAAGGTVVFRGFPGGNFRAFTSALAALVESGKRLDGVGIDPRLFRAFGVGVVPAYVMTSADFDLCDGFDCVTAVPPHDRMLGNVTASYALESFARGGGPGARLAALHLARLAKEDRQ